MNVNRSKKAYLKLISSWLVTYVSNITALHPYTPSLALSHPL